MDWNQQTCKSDKKWDTRKKIIFRNAFFYKFLELQQSRVVFKSNKISLGNRK